MKMKCPFTKPDKFATAKEKPCGKEGNIECEIVIKGTTQPVKACLFHSIQIAVTGLISRIAPAFLTEAEIEVLRFNGALFDGERQAFMKHNEDLEGKFFFRQNRLMQLNPVAQ